MSVWIRTGIRVREVRAVSPPDWMEVGNFVILSDLNIPRCEGDSEIAGLFPKRFLF
jgi:hypothetical protein